MNMTDAWAYAEAAARSWEGGRMESVEWMPLRDEATRWCAKAATNLGGWIGFGQTPEAALEDMADKCSGHGARLKVPA